MSARRDGALALVTLGVFLAGVGLANATLSPLFLALGAAGTLAFEAVAFERRKAIRRHWERPATQLVALALAVAAAGAGVASAPTSVLSAGIGALVAYLLVLAGVSLWR